MAAERDIDLYLPFDAGQGANVREDAWRRMARHFRYDGVIRGEGQDFRVRGDSSGMKVKVDPGECFIRGHWGALENTIDVPVANASNQVRRDLVVLRLNTQLNRIQVKTVEGTPGSSSWPVPTRTSTIWDIQIGRITVGANVNTITAASVSHIPHYTDGSARYVVDANLQQIPTSVNTAIDWDLPQWDSSAIDRNGLNEFIIRRAGMWSITANVRFQLGATTDKVFYVFIARSNQVNTNRVAGNSGYSDGISCTAQDRFQDGDAIKIWAWHNHNGNRQILNEFNATNVSFYWLGP